MILTLAEAESIRLLVSAYVLEETEDVLRRKKPGALGLLAVLLHHSRATLTPAPTLAAVQASQALTHHSGDALVLAAAQTAGVDYFVTLDQAHFLNNAAVRDGVPFPIGTPGDFLAWYREQLPNVEAP